MGGVSQETTDQEFRDYFAQFGRVVDATLMMDKDTGRPRGFGFVTFESEAGVEACIDVPLEIHGKPVEVKRAQPRGNLQEEEAAKRNRFKKGGEDMSQQMSGGGGGGGGNSGMTPQVMAQYFQRMQQYFAMMQSQMAMNRGMNMNPQMMQQMMQMQQMQQMQMMGRGGGGGEGGNNNITPQMMQQMMQQQQQLQQQQQQQQVQQQQQQQQAQQGEQGQGNFNNQQPQFPQQPPTGPSGGRRGGRGGFGGGGGAPTSWEGMYDDVPQPNAGGFRRGGGPGEVQNAPPANAPTGPKNAGRPGANYRGGGRGGNRGYHPYAR